MNKLIISLSPHAHGNDSVEKNMYGVIIALVPAILVSFFYFGLGSVVVLLSSVAACVFLEWAISKYILKTAPSIADGSAIVTGLLLGMNLPSNLPVWIVLIGAVVAIGIGKMTFGGLGNNPFNPALIGRCFLLASFPAQMTSWPTGGQLTNYVDAETAATPLSIMKHAIQSGDPTLLEQLPSATQLLLGGDPTQGLGSIGEICSLALILGLIYMLWRKVITWHIPISIIATVLRGYFQWWTDVGRHLHGHRLRHFAHDPQGTTHIRHRHRLPDGSDTQLGQLSRGHEFRHTHHERVHPAHQYLCQAETFR